MDFLRLRHIGAALCRVHLVQRRADQLVEFIIAEGVAVGDAFRGAENPCRERRVEHEGRVTGGKQRHVAVLHQAALDELGIGQPRHVERYAGLAELVLELDADRLHPPIGPGVEIGDFKPVRKARLRQQRFGFGDIARGRREGLDRAGHRRRHDGAHGDAETLEDRFIERSEIGGQHKGLAHPPVSEGRDGGVEAHGRGLRAHSRLDFHGGVALELGDLAQRQVLDPLHLTRLQQRDAVRGGRHLAVDDALVIGRPEIIIRIGAQHDLLARLDLLDRVGAEADEILIDVFQPPRVLGRGVLQHLRLVVQGGEIHRQHRQEDGARGFQRHLDLIGPGLLEFLDADEIVKEEGGALDLPRALETPDDVVRRHLIAPGAFDALTQLEDVGPAAVEDVPALGEIGLDLARVERGAPVGLRGALVAHEALVALRDHLARRDFRNVAVKTRRGLRRGDDQGARRLLGLRRRSRDERRRHDAEKTVCEPELHVPSLKA